MKKKFLILDLSLFFQGLALGLFAILFETPVGSFLFLNLGLSERVAYGIDDFLGWVLIASSIVLFFWKKLPVFLYMTLCFFAFALFQTIVGGVANSELTLFAHMARYLSPIGIYLIIKNSKYGLLLLKVGISATFFTHGLEALLREPLFVDFLIAALSIRENTAYYILYAIGIMDIFLAVLSPFARGPLIYFYMSFWGFITAFYRMLYEGGPGVLSLLMRSTHFLVPLFLGIYILKKSSNKNQGCL